MSHIHLDRTSSAELSVVQRAGADPHCFLLISETKAVLKAPSPLQAIFACAPHQPVHCKAKDFDSKGSCACWGFTLAGLSEWFFKPGADLSVSWTGVFPWLSAAGLCCERCALPDWHCTADKAQCSFNLSKYIAHYLLVNLHYVTFLLVHSINILCFLA